MADTIPTDKELFMKKILCAAASAVMMFSFMTGCGSKEAESESHGNMVGVPDADDNIGLDDMPYGSYVTEISPNSDEHITYKICYDSRYFGNEDASDITEIYRLHDFILAIDTNDHALMESLFYPGYLDYISEKDGATDIDEYLDTLYVYVESCLGSGFEMNYINVSNCYAEEDEEAVSYLESTDTEIYLFDSSLTDKITSKKVAEIGGDTYFKSDDDSGFIKNYMNPFILRIYEIDGETYLFM